MTTIERFIATEDETVLRLLADTGYRVAAGPYRITGGVWTYPADQVDKLFPGEPGGDPGGAPVSGQFNLRVEQGDGFVKVLIPADEGDGHSAGEALHALAALNCFDPLLRALRALKESTDRIEQRLNDPTGDGEGTDAQSPDGDSYNELWNEVSRAVKVLDDVPAVPEVCRDRAEAVEVPAYAFKSEDDRYAVINGLRVAATRYDEHVKTSTELLTFRPLAETFSKQAADARRIATEIEEG